MAGAIIAFILGILQTGSHTARMVTVYDGKVLPTLALSIILSISSWFPAHYVVDNNYLQFGMFCGGGALATLGLAYRNKFKKHTQLDTSKSYDLD